MVQNRRGKFIVSKLLACIVFFFALCAPASADNTIEIIGSGTVGDNISWTLKSDGTMTLKGSGIVWNIQSSYGGKEQSVKMLVLNEGITGIESYAFEGWSSLESVYLPASIQNLDECIFSDCDNLQKIYFLGKVPEDNSNINEKAFDGLTDLTVYYPSDKAPANPDANYGADGITWKSWEPAYPCSHTVVVDPAVEATCLEDGLTEGSHCSKCGTVFKEQETVPARDHEIVEDEEILPTCTEDGKTAGEHCSRCGEILTEQKTVPAPGHSAKEIPAKDPTCVEPGNTAGTKCSRCGEILSGNEEIPALGHTEVTDAAVAANCTESGKTEGSHCSVCGEVLVAQETVDPLGHQVVDIPEKAATCLEAGNEAGTKCERCGEVLSGNEVISKTKHTWNDGTVIKEATLSKSGELYQVCTFCGAEQTIITDPTGDRLSEDDEDVDIYYKLEGKVLTVAGTGAIPESAFSAPKFQDIIVKVILESGITEIGESAFEGCGFLKTVVLPAGLKTIGADAFKTTALETVVFLGNLPTEIDAEAFYGQYAAARYPYGNATYTALEQLDCSGNLIWSDYCSATSDGSVTEHDMQTVARVDETCTEAGTEGYSYCTACEKKIGEPTEIPAPGHKEESRNGKKATCTETGLTDEIYCTVCNEILTPQEVIPKAAHTEQVLPAEEATCQKEGLTEGLECKVCHTILKAQETVPMKEHVRFTVSGTPASCTKAGLTDYVICENCGTVLEEQETIPALGHTEVVDPAVAATCTETGLTAGSHCSVCGDVTTAQEITPALGHDMTQETITKEPTIALPGEKRLTCSRCGYSETEQIPRLGTACANDIYYFLDEETGLLSFEMDPNVARGSKEITGETFAGNGKIRKAVLCSGIESIGAKAFAGCPNLKEVILPASLLKMKDYAFANNAGLKVVFCGTIPEISDKALSESTVTLIYDYHQTSFESNLNVTYGGSVTWKEVCAIDSDGNCTDHIPQTIPGTPATCTATGWTEGSECSVCGKILQASEPILALGHVIVEDEEIPATCTETGKTAGTHCSRCGETLTAQEEIPALGHEEVTDAAVAPTCEKSGLSEGFHCSHCGEILTAQKEIPALGHTEVTDPAVSPTCTESGKTEGSHCSVCGKVLVAQKTVDPLGHQVVDIPKKEATCVEEGNEAGTKCERCGEVLSGNETIPAPGHQWDEGSVTKEASIAKSGEFLQTCTVCGEELRTVIPLTGTRLSEAADIYYKIEDNVLTLAGTGAIPESAFSVPKFQDIIVKVILESGITEIGESAFEGCSALKTAVIPAGIQTIGADAFKATALETVVFLGNLPTAIDAEAFYSQYAAARYPYGNATYTALEQLDCSRNLTWSDYCSATSDGSVTEHDMQTVARVDETCTEAGTEGYSYCTACEKKIGELTEIPAPGHKEESRNGKKATCTETGLTDEIYCTVCGEILTPQEVIPKAAHTEQVLPAEEATCQKEGLTEGLECKVCHTILKAQETVPKKEHVHFTVSGTPATCTKAGLTDYVICENCGTVLEEQETILALGHTEVADAAEDPTCTKTGLTEGSHCSVCGDVVTAQEIIPALGHDMSTETITTEPTIAFPGEKRLTCSRCGFSETEQILRLGTACANDIYYFLDEETGLLSFEMDSNVARGSKEITGETFAGNEKIRKAVLCDGIESIGEKAFAGCPNLKKVILPASLIKIKEYAFANNAGLEIVFCGALPEISNKALSESTATLIYNYHQSSFKSSLNLTYDGITTWKDVCKIDSAGNQTEHTLQTIEGTPATCTASGWTEGSECGVCGKIFQASEPIPALGHEIVEDEEILPTCTETGKTAGTHCSRCGEILTAQEEIPALGHKEVTDAAVAPTCEKSGLTEGSHCSRCGEILTAQGEIPAIGHTEVTDAAVAPTCIEAGLTEGSHCSVCGKVLVAQEPVKPLGHQVVDIPKKEATCVEEGNEAGTKCERCGEVLSGNETIPAAGHQWDDGSVEKEASIAKSGEFLQTCTVCGEELRTELPLTGTRLSEAADIYYKVDDKVLTAAGTGAIPESAFLSSEFQDVVKVIIQSGITEIGKGAFGNCGFLKTAVIPAGLQTIGADAFKTTSLEMVVFLGDLPTSINVDAFLNQDAAARYPYGNVTYTALEQLDCSRNLTWSDYCSATSDGTVTEHDLQTVAGKNATCTESGTEEYSYCNVCQKQVGAPTVIPALEHVEAYRNGKKATCTETGLTDEIYCERCKEVLTEQTEIPVIPHTEQKLLAVDPSCTEDGLTEGLECKVCHTILKAQEIIPALGHQYVSEVTKEATYAEAGILTKTCSVCRDVQTEIIPVLERIATITACEFAPNGEFGVKLTLTLPESTVPIHTYINGEEAETENGTLLLTYAPMDLPEELVLTLRDEEGTPVTLLDNFRQDATAGLSVYELAEAMEDSEKELLQAMRLLSACAKVYFSGSGTLTEEQKELLESVSPEAGSGADTGAAVNSSSDIWFSGNTIRLDKDISLCFVFLSAKGESKDYSFACSGTQLEPEWQGNYGIVKVGLPISDEANGITIEVKDAQDKELCRVSSSLTDYACSVQSDESASDEMKQLTQALLYYNMAAETAAS